MKTLTLKKYSDPSHGWASVKRKLLKTLDIEHLISSCSYQKGNSVYLEEDRDLSIFIKACESKNIELSFIYKNTNNKSPIRNYYCFKPT